MFSSPDGEHDPPLLLVPCQIRFRFAPALMEWEGGAAFGVSFTHSGFVATAVTWISPRMRSIANPQPSGKAVLPLFC